MINLTTYYTPLILFILYILLIKLNVLFVSIFIYLSYYMGNMYILCTSFIYITKIHKLHLFIYMFIFISYYYINQSLIDWDFILDNNYCFFNKNINDIMNTYLKLNTTYIEIESVSLVNNQFISTG